MFERWRQENFFKYMREEFLLDALVDYRIEAEDPTRTVLNPARRTLDKQIRDARTDLAQIERGYGAAAADNVEQRRPTMRGFKIAHAKIGKTLQKARARLTKLLDQRRHLPKRVEIRDLSQGSVVKLSTERKHLTDLIKMVAYQAESDLLASLRPHYKRVDQNLGGDFPDFYALAKNQLGATGFVVFKTPNFGPNGPRDGRFECIGISGTLHWFVEVDFSAGCRNGEVPA